MRFAVEITDTSLDLIRAQARYIAIDREAPVNANRWLEQVWDAIDALETMPTRYPLAVEDALKPYEIRRTRVGDFLILFTIDHVAATVWVIGFRHGNRLPAPDELPPEQPRAKSD